MPVGLCSVRFANHLFHCDHLDQHFHAQMRPQLIRAGFRGRVRLRLPLTAFWRNLGSKPPKLGFLANHLDPMRKPLSATVSDLVIGFIRNEGDLIARNLREYDDGALKAPFSAHYSRLDGHIKEKLEKLLDDYNRLVLLLSYPPEMVPPSITMHYYNQIDVSLDTETRKLLLNRMLSHRSFTDCAVVISETCETLNDVEDVTEAVVGTLVAEKNQFFGVLELLLECKKTVSNHSIRNALVDSIGHKIGKNRAHIEAFFLYVDELENLEDSSSFEAFLRLREGDVLLRAFAYRKALSLELPREVLSQFPVVEFKAIPGWIAFFGFQESMPRQLAVAALNQHDFLVLLHNTGPQEACDIYSHYVRNHRRGNCDSSLVVNSLVARMLENGPVPTTFYKQFSRENAAQVLRKLYYENRLEFWGFLLRLQKDDQLLSVVDSVVREIVEKGVSGEDALQLFGALKRTPLEQVLVRCSGRLLGGRELEKFLNTVARQTGSVRVLNEVARSACYGGKNWAIRKNADASEENGMASEENEMASEENDMASGRTANSMKNGLEAGEEKMSSAGSRLENVDSSLNSRLETSHPSLDSLVLQPSTTSGPSAAPQILIGVLHRIVTISLGEEDFQTVFSQAKPGARARFHNGIRSLGQTLSTIDPSHIGIIFNRVHQFLLKNYTPFAQEYLLRELATNVARFIHQSSPPATAIGQMGRVLKSLDFNCRPLQCAIYRYMVEDEPARAEKLLSAHAGNRAWLANDVMAAVQAGILGSKKADPWVKLTTLSAFRSHATDLGYRGKIQPSTAIRAIEVAHSVPAGLAQHEAMAWVWKLADDKRIPRNVRQRWRRKNGRMNVYKLRNGGHV